MSVSLCTLMSCFYLYNIIFIMTCYLNFYFFSDSVVVVVVDVFVLWLTDVLMDSALVLLSDDQAGFRTSACLMRLCLSSVCLFQLLLSQ